MNNKLEEFKKILETKDTFRRITAPLSLPAPLNIPDFSKYKRQAPDSMLDVTVVRNINQYFNSNKNKAASNELRGLCGWLADTFTNNVEARDFVRYLMNSGIRTREGSGDLRQQIQGLLTEFVVSSLFNSLKEQPEILWLKQPGWDKGEDVNFNNQAYDVKCIVRKSRWQEKWSELNLHPYQYEHIEENITDYLVLTSFSYLTKTIEIINVIPYRDIKKVLTFYRKGEKVNDSGKPIKDDVWELDYKKIEKYETEVKKDIEWAIKEIEGLKTETSENYPHNKMIEKEIVLGILNRLDEPEVNSQIDKLANFIMSEVEGEPSRSQSAVDTAIRVIKSYQNQEREERRKQEELEEQRKIQEEERRKRERGDIHWMFDKSTIGTDFETMETAGLPF